MIARVQDSRGRWNSLDCLLAFGWCGSAVAGGFLLDKFGFDLTFIITASAQVGLRQHSAARLWPLWHLFVWQWHAWHAGHPVRASRTAHNQVVLACMPA